MVIKYYYIDDDPNSQKKVEGFENEKLSIVAMQHKDSWEEQFSFLKEKEDDFDNGAFADRVCRILARFHHNEKRRCRPRCYRQEGVQRRCCGDLRGSFDESLQ